MFDLSKKEKILCPSTITNMWSNKKISFTVLLKNYFFGNGKNFLNHKQQFMQQFIHHSKALLNPKKLIEPKLEHFKQQNPLIRMFE
jgi:hypothetical protein